MVAFTLAGLFGAAIGGLIVAAVSDDEASSSAPTTVARAPIELPGDRLDLPAVVSGLSPSIVTVTATGGPGTTEPLVGTGIVLSAAGEIVTNAHLVDGAVDLTVLVAGEVTPRQAAAVGVDRATDLAVIRLADPTGLVPASFAAAGDIQIGDEVVALGHPTDGGAPSVTRGIVSSVDRGLTLPSGELTGLIQTDASIGADQSGGPLVNARGEVIGIGVAAPGAADPAAPGHLGFAVPVAQAAGVIDRLRNGDGADGAPAAAGYLGVDLGDRRDGGAGAVILAVVPDGPAAGAGLASDDVVVAVDSQPIDRAAGLAAAIREAATGSVLSLSVVRAGETLTVSVTVAARPAG